MVGAALDAGEGVPSGSVTPTDLYAAGNSPNGPLSQGPMGAAGANPGPKPTDFGSVFAKPNPPPVNVGPQFPPTPNGMSTFDSIEKLQENVNTKHIYQLPQGTQLPPGIDIASDGGMIGPDGKLIPAGHHTIYPSTEWVYENMKNTIQNLPWQYVPPQ